MHSSIQSAEPTAPGSSPTQAGAAFAHPAPPPQTAGSTGHPPALPAPAAPRWPPGWVRGVGVFTLLVAVVWAERGWWLFSEVGTLSLMNATQLLQFRAAPPGNQPNPAGYSNGRGGAGRRNARRSAPPAQPVNPLSILTFSRPLQPPPGQRGNGQPGDAQPGSRGDPLASAGRTAAESRAASEMRGVFLAEPIRQSWALLTAVLVGLIGAAGLGLTAAGSESRWFWGGVRLGMMVLFAVSVFALGAIVARHLPQSNHAAPAPTSAPSVLLADRWATIRTALEIGLVNLTQSRMLGGVFLLVALAVGAAAAGPALRREASVRAWMIVVIVAAFAGTIASLFAIALLIQVAKFPPLPPYVYALVSLLQSLVGWVMLWSLLYLPHARPRPAAPPPPIDPNAARVARRLGG